MALNFSGGTNYRVDHGSSALFENLSTLTLLAWIYPTSIVNGRAVIGNFRGPLDAGWALRISTSGNVSAEVGGSTYNYAVSNDDPISTNAWCFIGATHDFGNSANAYYGDFNNIVAEVGGYATQQTGVSQNDDSGRSLMVGNVDNATPNVAFTGYISFAALYNKVLSLTEMIDQQFSPHMTADCIFMCFPGLHGASTVPDMSGNGNHGTVTGATIAPHVSLGPPFGFDMGLPYLGVTGRSTKNTDSFNLGQRHGISFMMPT